MADVKKIAEEIVGLTLLEAVELKTILKEEYGIEAATGGAVMMAGPAGGAGEPPGAAHWGPQDARGGRGPHRRGPGDGVGGVLHADQRALRQGAGAAGGQKC